MNDSIPSWKCNLCGNEFWNYEEMLIHTKIHDGISITTIQHRKREIGE